MARVYFDRVFCHADLLRISENDFNERLCTHVRNIPAPLVILGRA
jgi:hypothetical protein